MDNLPFIIAEIAQGYEGSQKLVELYVKTAASVSADAIKFQIFYADELALHDYQYYDLFKSLELPCAVWDAAVQESHARGMEFYSDVFGPESFKMLENIGVDGYKIHATDVNNISLLKVVARSKKKVFLSTGGCFLDEIEKAIDILSSCDVVLMYGFQAEPTAVEDNNLNRISILKRHFKKVIGYQDHTDGDEMLAHYISFMTLGAGAEVIEKHLTLSRAAKIEDYISALTPEEFNVWAKCMKNSYPSLGVSDWALTEKEKEYRKKVRRVVCSASKINAGDVIQVEQVTLKRTDSANGINELAAVIGKIARKNININSAIQEGDLK